MKKAETITEYAGNEDSKEESFLQSKRKMFYAFIITFFINILCIPLWTEFDFVRTLFNKKAQLDLLYFGEMFRSKPFSYRTTLQPSFATFYYAIGENLHRADLSLRARGKWQKILLRLDALREGEVAVLLRGPKSVDEYGSSQNVIIDWRNFKINGEVIFAEPKTSSYNKFFSKRIPVKKGDVLKIEAEFRRHSFSSHDFTWTGSGKLWYILTGNLLLLFLIYRLLSFFGKYGKRIQPSEILLLISFFSFLFIPMMNISDAVRSRRENRALALKPSMKEILKGNMNTGGGYEKWFNDHFYGRVALVKLHDVIRNRLSAIVRTKGGAIYFKKNGWMFIAPVSASNYKPVLLQPIVHNLIQLNHFCQQHEIKFYILETPKKESVYKELIEDNYGFDRNKFVKFSQEQNTLREEVRKHGIPYIYPYNALRNTARQDFTFFKWSHHWTETGAFVAYRELMKQIRKDFPDMPVVSLDDYRRSQSWLIRDDYMEEYMRGVYLLRLFNVGNEDDPPNRTFYNYYDFKDADKMTMKIGRFTKEFCYTDGRHKVMLIGTSQNENLLRFLPYSAARTKYIRTNFGQVKNEDEFKILKLYKKDILAFKPDILILSIHTDNLPALRNLCSTK